MTRTRDNRPDDRPDNRSRWAAPSISRDNDPSRDTCPAVLVLLRYALLISSRRL